MSGNPDVLPLPTTVSANDLWLTSPDALLIVGAAGIIEAANPAAHVLFAHPQGSMPGYAVEQLLPANSQKNSSSQPPHPHSGRDS